ncbi:MAG: hypothetical protein ACHQDE_02635 [Acidimicrobiia bacterium]
MTASPPPLPVRPPRTLLVHFGIDSAVAFLALVLLGLIVGVPLVAIAATALVVGAVAARYTRRAEARALAARDRE